MADSLEDLRNNVRRREEGFLSVGKYSRSVYDNSADTFDEAVEMEDQISTNRKRPSGNPYETDVEGSLQRAKSNAERVASEGFIARARAERDITVARQRDNEAIALKDRYNTEGQIVSTTGALDRPVAFVPALGRDIGENIGAGFGELEDLKASGIASVLGEDSYIGRKVGGALEDGEQLSNIVTSIMQDSPWLKVPLNKIRDYGDKKYADKKDPKGFLDGIYNVHSSWLREMTHDFADILNEWYHDPRTLCCFIKNISAWATSTSGKMAAQQGKVFRGEVEFSAVSGTKKFFNKVIVILKLMRDFLQRDVGYDAMFNLDLGLMMAKASLGGVTAFLISLQHTLEESIYAELLAVVEKNTKEEWRQCFPFERMLRLMADALSGPEGLFSYIEQYVNSFMNGFSAGMNFGFSKSAKSKMIDVTAIDKLITMLEAIRDSLLNLELCLEADFSATRDTTDDANQGEKHISTGSGDGSDDRDYSKLAKQLTGKSQGNIDRSTGRFRGGIASDSDNVLGGNFGNLFPTDTEIEAFVTGRLGETKAFAKQVIATAGKSDRVAGRATGSPDSNGADSSTGGLADQLQKSIGDCSRTLNTDQINDLANLMANWELKV